jgi:hypothetical protein
VTKKLIKKTIGGEKQKAPEVKNNKEETYVRKIGVKQKMKRPK